MTALKWKRGEFWDHWNPYRFSMVVVPLKWCQMDGEKNMIFWCSGLTCAPKLSRRFILDPKCAFLGSFRRAQMCVFRFLSACSKVTPKIHLGLPNPCFSIFWSIVPWCIILGFRLHGYGPWAHMRYTDSIRGASGLNFYISYGPKAHNHSIWKLLLELHARS